MLFPRSKLIGIFESLFLYVQEKSVVGSRSTSSTVSSHSRRQYEIRVQKYHHLCIIQETTDASSKSKYCWGSAGNQLGHFEPRGRPHCMCTEHKNSEV